LHGHSVIKEEHKQKRRYRKRSRMMRNGRRKRKRLSLRGGGRACRMGWD